MKIADTDWTLGAIIGWPLAATSVALLLFAALHTRRWRLREREKKAAGKKSYEQSYGEASVAFWGLVLSAAIIVVAVGAGSWPYKAEYHQWRAQHGTVESIESRIVAGSSSPEEKFVVTFEGSPTQYGCTDTRCAGIEVGDDLSLACIRKWEWAATDGYDCRFVDYQQKD